MFSKNENSGGSASNTGAARETNTTRAAAEPTPKAFTKDDYVGRWGVNRDFKDHVVELRDDGTGTIILDENGKNQVKQNFTWNYEAKNAVFTVRSPIVNQKLMESGSYTIHAKLIEDGTKLQTDFSPYTRSKGEDVWNQK